MAKPVRIVNLCPYCGNEISYSLINNKQFKDVKCPYCKNTFRRFEIIKEKEKNK